MLHQSGADIRVNRSRLSILSACVVGVVICGLILVTGPEPLEATVPEDMPRVTVTGLERDVVANTITAFGVLTPRQTLQLATQVAGEIAWVSENLEAGKQVAQDELLLRVDERDYTIALASAQARYAQAEANIEIEEGRAEIARLEWAAWQESNDDPLPANPLALRAPQRAEAVAQRRAIAAELDQAKLNLKRTAIRAPWPATVVDADAVVGRVLSIGEVTALLFPLDYAVFEVQIPIKTMQLLEQGTQGMEGAGKNDGIEGIEQIELRPVHDLTAPPVVGKLEGVVKSLTEDTRLATLRVRIEHPLEHAGWAYGMHLQAKLVARQQRPVTHIPADLIVSGNLIWIYRDGRAQRHQVFPVEANESTVAVEDNFDADDALIVERPIGLFDGALVEVAAASSSVADKRKIDP